MCVCVREKEWDDATEAAGKTVLEREYHNNYRLMSWMHDREKEERKRGECMCTASLA